ncbi:chemotaxis protein CheZ [Methylobacterium phyllosphaerae]|jgi:chemotaxis protein CheZ|uniref:Chemotaxis protein CheZ n=2 Tax=Methylobacterium TaxID=407 RepID=A0AAE8L8E0_9HYPH|nr:protein phosphatase CheZ [Methylobacterium fujisawaense]APT34635.1 chemotaxis protein CheZ [Methylobacterium phyllosphaerae]KOX47919.1 chemotaxis protein CheZ [Streptomyces purpurogeneiscleroticus]MBP31457.1 chemotaxis protein CheZ [Methylobacterium sp.]SFV02850.1 chemotaxis protein CheZ [Methylobacterium sp. UNCCL125]MBA9064364.1 chemotaxis protein CheZ [Methylobacterium fujisawaense]
MARAVPDVVSIEEGVGLLRSQLVSISDAIARTRQEIADLRQEQETSRACDELHAVVQGTEDATNAILTASETVDGLARGIVRRSEHPATRADAEAIQAEMQTIFEACNFQDLTGQRISKVVRTIVLVEERIGEMLRVWSASGDGPARPNLPHDRRSGEAALLNGPVLPGDASVSQDTVDAMFP